MADLIRARSRWVFDPVEVPLGYLAMEKSTAFVAKVHPSPRYRSRVELSFSPSKPQTPIWGRTVPRTCGIWLPCRRNRAERVQVFPPILHCVFRRGSPAKLSSAPIMSIMIIIMIDIDDHADGVSGADHAADSNNHHDGGGASSTMMPTMAVEFVAARSWPGTLGLLRECKPRFALLRAYKQIFYALKSIFNLFLTNSPLYAFKSAKTGIWSP